MKQFQYTVRPDEAWNTGAIEQWLEQKAAQGWRLYHCGGNLVRFERAEPAACRVRLQPREPEPFEAWQEHIAAYEELGWVYAAELREEYEVFYCGDPAAPELESDPAVQKWAWEKSLKRGWRNSWLLLLGYAGLLAWVLWLLVMAEEPVETLLKGGAVLALSIPLLFAVAFGHILRRLRSVRRARRLLDAGIAPPHTGDWKRMRRLDVFSFVCAWALWVIVLVHNFAPIFTDRSWDLDEAEGLLPYVAAETLDPALAGSLGKYGWVSLKRTALAPEQYEILEVYPGQARVETTCDRLLVSALAGPLYREKLTGLREDLPSAALTVLDREGFDKAAVLEGEASALVACRGNVVLTVRVSFPAELDEHLEDFAGVLAEFQEKEACP